MLKAHRVLADAALVSWIGMIVLGLVLTLGSLH